MPRESAAGRLLDIQHETVIGILLICAYVVVLGIEAWVGTGDPLHLRAARVTMLSVVFMSLGVYEYLRTSIDELQSSR